VTTSPLWNAQFSRNEAVDLFFIKSVSDLDLIAGSRLRRSPDLIGSVGTCAKRMCPHYQSDPLCGEVARMLDPGAKNAEKQIRSRTGESNEFICDGKA
jgi:hypothetical protein